MIATTLTVTKDKLKGESMRKAYEIPYSSRHEYFNCTSIAQLHAITMLSDGWNVENNRFNNTFMYTKNFKVNDYDASKDYFLDAQSFNTSAICLINGKMHDISASLCDITHFIHQGENTLVVVVQFADHSRDTLLALEKMLIIERANDRISRFDVTTNYDEVTNYLHIKLRITDIEGAPMPSYTLVDTHGNPLISGMISLDDVNHIDYPLFTNTSLQDSHYCLFIDTDDETLVHTLNIAF